MRRYFDRTVWAHLRVPFSLFLMPVFGFALSQASRPDAARTTWAFVILHLLIYPASNAYNSYYDRDQGPIGGLEKPPPVDTRLLHVAWVLDAAGLVLGAWLVGLPFAGAMLVYGLVSRAYSYEGIRLKKYPVVSWLVVGSFQGAFTYLTVSQAIDAVPLAELAAARYLIPSLLSTLNLLAFYPLSQIYQHDEDARRGDLTLSRLLGVRGTFLVAGGFFVGAAVGFLLFFRDERLGGVPAGWVLAALLVPAVLYFLAWGWRAWNKPERADFQATMRLTVLGSQGLNLFFVLLLLQRFG